MNEKLKNHLDEIFSSYKDLKIVNELKEELLIDLQDKMSDLIAKGHKEDEAFEMTIKSLGDISEILKSIDIKAKELSSRTGMNFSMSSLKVSDFKDLNLEKSKFNASSLEFSDFTNSDLSGCSFNASDLKGSNFKGANLTGSSLKASNLEKAVFDSANLTNAKIVMSSLKGATFKDADFTNADFTMSELSGVNFDNQIFIGTIFNYAGLKGVSFKNAEFRNVSFKTEVKKTIFDGAKMDKVTFALLMGYKAKLENVTVI
jgi:BTB/POZ domain-containing protein KCTD9